MRKGENVEKSNISVFSAFLDRREEEFGWQRRASFRKLALLPPLRLLSLLTAPKHEFCRITQLPLWRLLFWRLISSALARFGLLAGQRAASSVRSREVQIWSWLKLDERSKCLEERVPASTGTSPSSHPREGSTKSVCHTSVSTRLSFSLL
jgi:hypothetical protein